MDGRMSSAEVVAAFVRGRKELEAEIRRHMEDGFKAPEVRAEIARELVVEALEDVSDEERGGLDRMRGNGAVDWTEVASLLGAPPVQP